MSRALVLGGAAALAAVAAMGLRSRKKGARAVSGTGRLRTAALNVALTEDRLWGDSAPDTAQVDLYLAGCIPNGAALAQANTDSHRINFCAAAVGWTEAMTGLKVGEQPLWRSVAKQIMRDCKNGERGVSTWHPIEEVRGGWLPPPGALAIYHRGAPGAFTGHVDRVLDVGGGVFNAIGANEGGRQWSIAPTRLDSPALLGFVVDGEAPRGAQPGEPLARELEEPIPEGFIEPLLSPEDERFIRGYL